MSGGAVGPPALLLFSPVAIEVCGEFEKLGVFPGGGVSLASGGRSVGTGGGS